ncbi:MAG: ATP-dependent helicase [Opitutales bacterium]|nr:ATP-dependent helicase [Opitutales bacterium]
MDFNEHFSPVNPIVDSIDFKSALNEDQYRAVSAPFGPALVLAGAGSGKTRTLTYRVAWLLKEGVRPSEILLLTFTNKAAREMLERVEELTGVSPRQFWGGTFHHVGQRVLRTYGEFLGLKRSFNIIDESDAEALLTETIRDTDKEFLKIKDHPKAKVIGNMISYARNTLKPISEVVEQKYPFFEELSGKINQFAKLYAAAKMEQQVCDYDDLLEHWLKVLETNEDAAFYYQNRFQHILVDEYQDTNLLQSKIIDAMGIHHRIMAVGDDAQCIYTWRGANYDNIISFPERHPNTEIYKIEVNYRSTPQILEFANHVLETQPAGMGYKKELRPSRESLVIPYFVHTVDTRQQAQFVASRITRLVQEGSRSLDDIAVLYRAHFQAMDLQIELSKRGIPFVITSGVKFFEQAHVRDLVSQLRFACNPEDMTAFLRFTGLLPKVGARTAAKLFEISKTLAARESMSIFEALKHSDVIKKVPAAAKEEWPSLVQTLEDIATAVETQKPERVVMLAVEGWYSSFIREVYPNWTTRLDDLESLVGFASRFDTMEELLAQLILLNSETSDRSIEGDTNCVRLTTVHQSKGLEYPVVFVIGLADGQFPLKRAIEEDNIEEERRLFYVSVTRAMDELYLSYPILQTHGGPPTRMEPSRFIRALPQHCFETVSIQRNYY